MRGSFTLIPDGEGCRHWLSVIAGTSLKGISLAGGVCGSVTQGDWTFSLLLSGRAVVLLAASTSPSKPYVPSRRYTTVASVISSLDLDFRGFVTVTLCESRDYRCGILVRE
jgi:hypothetical protein